MVLDIGGTYNIVPPYATYYLVRFGGPNRINLPIPGPDNYGLVFYFRNNFGTGTVNIGTTSGTYIFTWNNTGNLANLYNLGSDFSTSFVSGQMGPDNSSGSLSPAWVQMQTS